jgi:hypothetical protein
MRFDVQIAGSGVGPLGAAERAALDAALRAEYAKAPTQLPAAPSRTRQVTNSLTRCTAGCCRGKGCCDAPARIHMDQLFWAG